VEAIDKRERKRSEGMDGGERGERRDMKEKKGWLMGVSMWRVLWMRGIFWLRAMRVCLRLARSKGVARES
jgi:hypothetical protein